MAGDDAADLEGHLNSFSLMEFAVKSLATEHQTVKPALGRGLQPLTEGGKP
jgi:hypothetical protein